MIIAIILFLFPYLLLCLNICLHLKFVIKFIQKFWFPPLFFSNALQIQFISIFLLIIAPPFSIIILLILLIIYLFIVTLILILFHQTFKLVNQSIKQKNQIFYDFKIKKLVDLIQVENIKLLEMNAHHNDDRYVNFADHRNSF